MNPAQWPLLPPKMSEGPRDRATVNVRGSAAATGRIAAMTTTMTPDVLIKAERRAIRTMTAIATASLATAST